MNKLLNVVICGWLIVVLNSCNQAPGSYPNAELYEIGVSEEKLIEAVNVFKTRNNQFTVPEDIPLLDGRRDSLDHWYHIYFFDSDRNEVIKTWVRGFGSSKTKFALIAVYDSKFTERWKFVNKDFSQSENNEVKKRFEDKILIPVKKILQ